MSENYLFIIIIPNDWNLEENENIVETKETTKRLRNDDATTPKSQRPIPRIITEPKKSICKIVKHSILEKYGLVEKSLWLLSNDQKYYEVTFVCEFSSFCEELLHQLSAIDIGIRTGTRVAVLPVTCALGYRSHVSSNYLKPVPIDHRYRRRNQNFNHGQQQNNFTKVERLSTRRKSVREDFMQSIRSRLMVFQVVQAIRNQSSLTFDFVVLITLASILAMLGLLENSSVILVASMLVSPLMGPILAIVFGLVIHDRSLWKIGLRSELIGLFICVSCGFLFGLCTSYRETNWGSSTSFPTAEMRARGDLSHLLVGGLIALPSGAGVALSVLGGNAGSLVGVAISASLLPPAVNSGLLLSYSLLSAALPLSIGRKTSNINETFSFRQKLYPYTSYNCTSFEHNSYRSLYSCSMTYETLILAGCSFLLTLLNILCIILMGIVVLKIKEVAPTVKIHQSDTDKFFHNDIRLFRDYHKTIHQNEAEKVIDEVTTDDNDDSTKKERLQQLMALATVYDLDLKSESDLTLNNPIAREKVKKLYETLLLIDQEAKRLDFGRRVPQGPNSMNIQPPLPSLMEILPPKWTELFQQQHQHKFDDDKHPLYNQNYYTYHNQQLRPKNQNSVRTLSCSNNFSVNYEINNLETHTNIEEQDEDNECQETLLQGTRFRLKKAKIKFEDEQHV